MNGSSAATARGVALVATMLCVAMLDACSGDASRAIVPTAPTRVVTKDTGGGIPPLTDSLDTRWMSEPGSCDYWDQGHCDFLSITTQEIDWMWDAVDAAQCPLQKAWLSSAMLRGWIHKVELRSRFGWPTVNGETHTNLASTSWARMHLDPAGAFTSAFALRGVLYHEATHVLHPTINDDGEIERLAQAACY